MPRDLEMEKPVQLTESPNSTLSSSFDDDSQPTTAVALTGRNRPQQNSESLHPYTRPLTINDVESCVALENAAFDESERCSPEKFNYRLTKCGELCLGLFCTATPDSSIPAETLKTGRVVETSRKNGAINVLLAHIVATKSNDVVVTDEAMDYPKDWKAGTSSDAVKGHQESGRTVCIHSLGVVPGYQKRGLGRILLTAYIQQISGAGIADRISLLAHEHMVSYYERFGFKNLGPSKAQFGGGNWFDMVRELKAVEARAVYGI